MILVILGIFITLVVAGFILADKFFDEDFFLFVMVVPGVLGTIVSLIATICLMVGITNLNVIDDKIAMYEAENQKIELQIADTVKQYQAYESGIFSEVSPENAVTYVSLYPDLKADTLVQKQIEVYAENNEQIKELKEQQISGDVKRWWLYFGGRSETE
jgi:hypothetical protein